MPRVTSAKWDRTLVLNIPIFITIWLGLRAALEIHFRLIIRHQVLGYRLNSYCLEVTGYSDDPWWREFYIDFELSRLQFGSRPIGPTGDGPSGWNDNGDKPPPHGEQTDHLPDPSEGRPPTPPWQPSSSSSNTDNIQVIVNQNRHTPKPVPPLRCYVSQHLNLLGTNPTISSGSHPHETLVRDTTSRTESEVEGEQIQTPENRKVPDELEDDDLPPLPMAPRPRPAQAQEPRDLTGHLVPPLGHHIVHTPPRPDNPVQRMYTGWQEYFDNLHNRSNPNWGNNPMGPIVENLSPGESSDYRTPPQGEAEAKTSGAEADTEEAVEDPLQDELNSPMEETEGYSVDPWPEVDQALEEVFNREYED